MAIKKIKKENVTKKDKVDKKVLIPIQNDVLVNFVMSLDERNILINGQPSVGFINDIVGLGFIPHLLGENNINNVKKECLNGFELFVDLVGSEEFIECAKAYKKVFIANLNDDTSKHNLDGGKITHATSSSLETMIVHHVKRFLAGELQKEFKN